MTCIDDFVYRNMDEIKLFECVKGYVYKANCLKYRRNKNCFGNLALIFLNDDFFFRGGGGKIPHPPKYKGVPIIITVS